MFLILSPAAGLWSEMCHRQFCTYYCQRNGTACLAWTIGIQSWAEDRVTFLRVESEHNRDSIFSWKMCCSSSTSHHSSCSAPSYFCWAVSWSPQRQEFLLDLLTAKLVLFSVFLGARSGLMPELILLVSCLWLQMIKSFEVIISNERAFKKMTFWLCDFILKIIS